MKIKFYGTRGSIPTPSMPGFSTIEYGGNTTCMCIEHNGYKHIIDAGTGIRLLGLEMAKEPGEANLYITHTHWDHIQGFPFFIPAYVKGNKINIYGEAKVSGDLIEAMRRNDPLQLATMQINGSGIKEVMSAQQNPRNFPAPLEYMNGIGEFNDFLVGGKIYDKDGLTIETMAVNHPGGCVSYKFTERKGRKKKVIVVSTDFEPDDNGYDDELVKWWKGADIVVADAQYEKGSAENPYMKGYGHSDYLTDIDLAERAGAKKLILTHHEPKVDDDYCRRLEGKAQDAAPSGLEVLLARELMEATV